MGDFSTLFEPDRIAVIGATERDGSVGRAITQNLLSTFDGTVVPVNPNYDEVFGIPCIETIAETDDIDLAIVAVPPEIAIESVERAGEAAVSHVVVITAGFSEAGSEGAALERRLAGVADRYDLSLVGPNSLGVMSTAGGFNATFGPDMPLQGSISFMSQSGAFITATLDWAAEQEIGFRHVVSLGNEAVLDETDFVRGWDDDPGTSVVVGYLEGIDDGETFIETTRHATQETPVVFIKSGRTEAGAKAAASHTGSIAGSERAYEAGLAQAGVIRADSASELFDYARVLAGQPLPDGESVGVVTNAGGLGVMTTDAIGGSILSMASFTDETVAALQDRLPDTASVYNPVDVVGDADLDRFRSALDVVFRDATVDSVVVLSAPTAVLDYEDLADATIECYDEYEKPVVTCLMGGARTRDAATTLREAGIPNYFDPSRAIDSLEALSTYRHIRERPMKSPPEFDVDHDRAREVLERATEKGETRLGVEAMGLLDAYGIPTPAGTVVDDPETAETVARDIGDSVAMKVVSPDILHKTDIGGVELDVAPGDVPSVYEDLVSRARSYQPDATVLGVQIQEMIDLDARTETIVGLSRDPQFGPLVLFGLGGIFVEVLEDTAIRVAPIGEREAREMIDDLKAAPLLRGARGRDPADEAAVRETIQRIAQLATDFPAILELDVNPLVAGPDGVVALDVRLTVDTEKL